MGCPFRPKLSLDDWSYDINKDHDDNHDKANSYYYDGIHRVLLPVMASQNIDQVMACL